MGNYGITYPNYLSHASYKYTYREPDGKGGSRYYYYDKNFGRYRNLDPMKAQRDAVNRANDPRTQKMQKLAYSTLSTQAAQSRGKKLTQKVKTQQAEAEAERNRKLKDIRTRGWKQTNEELYRRNNYDDYTREKRLHMEELRKSTNAYKHPIAHKLKAGKRAVTRYVNQTVKSISTSVGGAYNSGVNFVKSLFGG